MITGLTLTSDEPGTLTIRWDAANTAPKDYRVRWAKVGDGFNPPDDKNWNAYLTETSYTITGLEPGVQYRVQVGARYSESPTQWSEQVRRRVAANPTSTSTPTATATATATATPTATDCHRDTRWADNRRDAH